MVKLFQLTDPRGYDIQCDEDCWANHILAKHTELKGHRELVERTLADPDIIFEAAAHVTREVYSLANFPFPTTAAISE